MQRTIVQPPVPGDAALAELKQWLGVTRPNDDAMLTGLIQTSLTICEAFTGKTPLRQTVEEIVALTGEWQELVSRPVSDIAAATLIAADGSRQPVTTLSDALAWRISPGSACVRLQRPFEGRGMALRLVVGIAADWASLPPPLRQGIIRFAAHHYRDRDSKASAIPPASVTALWRPWREMAL